MAAQDRLEGCIDEAVGVKKANVGTDAKGIGNSLRKPVFHAHVLNDDYFSLERIAKRSFKDADKLINQPFDSIAHDKVQPVHECVPFMKCSMRLCQDESCGQARYASIIHPGSDIKVSQGSIILGNFRFSFIVIC